MYYHGTYKLNEIIVTGFIRAPVYVTRSFRLAKAQVSRHTGLDNLAVLALDVSDYGIVRDKMYKRWSRDPLLGPTYVIYEDIPVSQIISITREGKPHEWFEEKGKRYEKYYKLGSAR